LPIFIFKEDSKLCFKHLKTPTSYEVKNDKIDLKNGWKQRRQKTVGGQETGAYHNASVQWQGTGKGKGHPAVL
tara:strand:- start:164 stop:382 length:219 start_codon:yes stop_codon:yes gene_type:complete